jgi:hypothetical protein
MPLTTSISRQCQVPQQAARARQFGGDFGLRFVFDGLELSNSIHGEERCKK